MSSQVALSSLLPLLLCLRCIPVIRIKDNSLILRKHHKPLRLSNQPRPPPSTPPTSYHNPSPCFGPRFRSDSFQYIPAVASPSSYHFPPPNKVLATSRGRFMIIEKSETCRTRVVESELRCQTAEITFCFQASLNRSSDRKTLSALLPVS